MIALAAIDVRAGQVVQLVGGRPEDERIRLADPPEAVARRWVEHGFAGLHVVDLDAALGDAPGAAAQASRAAVEAILGSASVPVQVGGGVRDEAVAGALLASGASAVVVGTRGVGDPEWLARLAERHPGRVVLAADVRGGRVVTHGWTRDSGLQPESLLSRLDPLPLAGVLVTDVSREGGMAGIDVRLFRRLVRATRHPVQAAGGIGGTADLHALERVGAAAAVVGMALYTGAVDAHAVAREFAA